MQEHGCSGKVRHNTFAEAKKHIKKPYKTGQHSKLARERLGVYKCEQCHKWHVGKTIDGDHTPKRTPPYKRKRLQVDI